MTEIATKLEDIGDERDQAVFMATVRLWFGGNFQAALDEYNRCQVIFDNMLNSAKPHSKISAEVRLQVPHL